MATSKSSKLFINQVCERCGSVKLISKPKIEELKTSMGFASVEVSHIICSNKVCQAEFDKERAETVLRVNERKAQKVESDRIRKENKATNQVILRNKAANQ